MKHKYQIRGVVGGAYKLFDIVSLEMTLNERIKISKGGTALIQHPEHPPKSAIGPYSSNARH